MQDALSRAGYSSAMMSLYNDKGYASQRFQRAHRHDLWQGDIKYGLILNLGGKTTQTYFSCLIDDATRYILHGEFYGNMEQGIVEDTLRKAMTKYGLPKRLYFDNGSQYRTRWMKRALWASWYPTTVCEAQKSAGQRQARAVQPDFGGILGRGCSSST